MRVKNILFLALPVSPAICSPVQNPGQSSHHSLIVRDDSNAGSLDACGRISQTIQRYNSSEPPQVDAATAFECLKSTPFDAVKAKSFIDEIKKYVAAQCSLAYLKDPPEGYLMPAVDILGELDNVGESTYSSHYDFDVAVSKVFTSAYDGHFRINLCSLNQIHFRRGDIDLISYTDGVDNLPRLYILQDVLRAVYEPSPVHLINGENAESYIEQKSHQSGRFHDPDALYNSMLSNLQSLSQNRAGSLQDFSAGDYVDFTTITFDNGTTKIYNTTATVSAPNFWKSIDSAEGFMETFCINSTRFSNTSPNGPSAPKAVPISSETTPSIPPPGYPESAAVFYSPDLLGGYFLDDVGVHDVAVLAVFSFVTDGSTAMLNSFMTNITKFLEYSHEQGKTKLIIDVSGNGGGKTVLGPVLFSRLFPRLPIWTYANRRATKLFELLGNIASFPLFQQYRVQDSEYSSKQMLKPDQSGFSSFEEYFGPVQARNDTFTKGAALVDFRNDLPGYLSSRPQIFDPDDIVLLSDGQCSSTCAILYELMRTHAGVKTIVVGGRPQYAPMQFVGGVKGAIVYSNKDHFDPFVEQAREMVNVFGLDIDRFDGADELVNGTVGDVVPIGADNLPYQVSEVKLTMNNLFRVDPRDGSVQGDIPLQFLYEKADCRLFYTKDTIFNPQKHWARVADTTWGNGTCVEGST